MLERLRTWRPTPVVVTRLALVAIVANSAIVLTGGAVRLTGSGLGCPDWPTCDGASYVATQEYGVHGLIEFGNRLLTFALTAVVVALLVAVVRSRPRRGPLVRLAVLGFLGIPAQGVLGGITVLTGLNPWTVMLHFLLSCGLIAVSVVTWQRSREGDGPVRRLVPAPLATASYALLAVVGVTLALGTVVTGSGPHSGDPKAGRTGLDPETVSQLHADLVFVLVGLTVGLLVAFRATGSRGPARATAVLLAVELSQGVVGFVQYWTDLPVLLVALHMLGACLIVVAATRVVLATRERPAVSPAVPGPP